MYIFKKVDDLQNHLEKLRQAGSTIGFAPTMGALHSGHLSLINAAKSECDISVCSIFVNPTQFNESSDLDKYPRTAGADIDLLTQVENDILFMPPVEEVYPKDLDTTLSLDFGQLANVMEGQFRPGHFDGMAQVVKRLLDIVQPNRLYMGQKDYQQFAIVQNMLKQLESDITIVRCPIIREDDGLAMSSRNVRLTPEFRASAPIIHDMLLKAKDMAANETPQKIMQFAKNLLDIPGYKMEYFDIVDGESLQAFDDFKSVQSAVACVAIWAGDVRLIDNIILK